jgi:hypothetical protein
MLLLHLILKSDWSDQGVTDRHCMVSDNYYFIYSFFLFFSIFPVLVHARTQLIWDILSRKSLYIGQCPDNSSNIRNKLISRTKIIVDRLIDRSIFFLKKKSRAVIEKKNNTLILISTYLHLYKKFPISF